MSSLKKSAMILLIAMIALVLVPMSFASDVDDIVAADDADAVVAVDDVDIVSDDASSEVVNSASTDDIIAEPEQNKTADDIKNLIDAAEDGGTITLSGFYDVKDTSIAISKTITIVGDEGTIIYGHGAGNGIFNVGANGVIIKNIKFIDTNPDSITDYYDNAEKNKFEIKGWGVRFGGASNGVVDNCQFIDFNHGVRIQGQSNNVLVSNCYFTGWTNYLRNDPLVNVEKGTKAIGVMGSQGVKIINNTFDGKILDGVSIAQGCGGAYVFNNTFKHNSYAIYFGGASTDGTIISNNTFIDIGHFEGTDNRTGDQVTWNELPIISIQKAASGIEITNNKVQAVNGNIVIAAEAGNTAHGGASELGDVTVTGNIIESYEGAVTSTVTLLHILSRGGDFNPFEGIDVSDNTLNGAKSVAYWDNTWGDEHGDAEIPKGDLAVSIIKITSVEDNVITAKLVDGKGDAIDGATIVYSINGGDNQTVEADENGVFTVTGEAGKSVLIVFDNNKFTGDSISIVLPETPSANLTASLITANDITVKAGNTGNIVITLKDSNGVPIANKTISVEVNGEPLFIGPTDANGVANVPVKYANAGVYYAYVNYVDETGKYVSSFETVKITVTKKATTLTAKKATLKVKKAKKIKVTLKSEGKALAKKQVTIKVNKKTFKAKTNAKGVATIKVKVTKKGKFTAVVKFAGDGAYKAVTKKVKFTVKK